MTHPRVSRLADVLVNYSLELKKGDLFHIQGDPVSIPLVTEIYRKALSVGAHPEVRIKPHSIEEVFFKEATADQLTYVSDFEKLATERLDAAIHIWGSQNTRALSNIPPERVALCQRSRQEIFKRRLERIAKGDFRWCGTQYPTNANAQDAEMSLEEYEDFVFKASFLDKSDPVGEWKKLSLKQERLTEFLSRYKEIRIVAKDTDLTLRVDGRHWINCDGKENFPDGEIFTSPVEDSAEGRIHYAFPAVYRTREATDVTLRFESGKVVEARAGKGEDYLHSMLDIDDGAKRIGEFAFGTNPEIQQFTRNTLFDEKIDGTIHIALGASLPESGGKNISALHWDMVCDLRSEGEVYGDGELIYKQGKFLIE